MYDARGKLNSEDLILNYMPLVKKVALSVYKQINFAIELDELIGCGTLGLMDSLSNYVQMDNAKFETYATTRIRGSILDKIRQNDHLTQDDRTLFNKVSKATQFLYNKTKAVPTAQEIAQYCNISVNEYFEILHKNQIYSFVSMEESTNECMDVPMESHAPDEQVYKKQLVEKITVCIDTLPEKEKAVMHFIYVEDLDAKDVAYIMKITPARVSQLHAQALHIIKQKLNPATPIK